MPLNNTQESPSKIISAASVAKSGSRVSKKIGPSKCPDDNVQINLRKKDGVVEMIEIQCKCGETIVIECDYSS